MGLYLGESGLPLVGDTGLPFVCDDCPCGGCPVIIELTLAGIDGGSFCSCVQRPDAPSLYYTLFSLGGADGTYSLNYRGTFIVDGLETCLYSLQVPTVNSTFSIYSRDSDCSGSPANPNGSASNYGLYIEARVRVSDRKVYQVFADWRQNSARFSALYYYRDTVSGMEFDTPYATSISCGEQTVSSSPVYLGVSSGFCSVASP